ncbi:MAG TPA: MFS transporter [Dongiaceae bacterium]|nr:MFS transporter [Dongiaceae bacterium]
MLMLRSVRRHATSRAAGPPLRLRRSTKCRVQQSRTAAAMGADSSSSPPASMPRASPLTPFKYRVFLALWLASLASNFGGLIQSVGASWLMTSLAPTADIVALVQASTVLPIMLFSLAAGAAADVFDRRRLMLIAQCLALAVSAALAILAFVGLVTPWILLTFTFLIGCTNALYGPAWQSSVGDLVPRHELPAAVALNSLGFNIARTVGPAIGGFIVAVLGSQTAFLVNAVSYVGLIVVLFTWKRPLETQPVPPEGIGSAMISGLRYVHLSPVIRSVLVRSVVFGFAASAVWALMPLIARDQIGGGPTIYGLLLGAFGVGAVLSALGSTHLRARFRTERIVDIATASFAIASLTSAASGLLVPTMAGMILGGAGWVLALSNFNTSIQLSVPRWVVGRAVAIYQTLTFGSMALGSWIWGLVAHRYGLPFSLEAAGILLVASLALSRLMPMAAASGDNLDLRHPDSDPTIDKSVPYSGGRVVVTIEYRVALADARAFMSAMRPLQQIRQRNGASRWTLMVDVADPELWIERFQCATWLDYLRQRHRVTIADRVLWERARAFHRGASPPRVRRLMAQPLELLAGAERSHQKERAQATSVEDPTLPPAH